MSAFNVAHLSLRYDADQAAMARYVAEVATRHEAGILTTTESKSRRLTKLVRRELPRHYRAARRHEYIIVWDGRRFRSLWPARLVILTPVRYWMLGANRRLFRMARKNLRHRDTGRRVRVEAAHAPSGIQGGSSWRKRAKPNRIQAAKRGFRSWGRKVESLLSRRPRAVQLLNMDANLDERRPAWRRYLDATLGARSVWHGHMPRHGGTHGNRVIDVAHVVNVDVRSAWLTPVERPAGVDHRGFVYRVKL